LNDMLTTLMTRLDHVRVVNQIKRAGHLPLIRTYLENIQQFNLIPVNQAVNEMFIEEGDHTRLRNSVDQFENFDALALAKDLQDHGCLEFRRISSHLYKKNKRWNEAVSLAKKDNLYKDAMETARASQDNKIVDDLLEFFVENGHQECFAAALFMCYEFVTPDGVLLMAWKHKLMDFAMPYFVQQMAEVSELKNVVQQMSITLTQLMQGGGQPAPAPVVQQAPQQFQQPAPGGGGFGFVQ